MTLNNQLLSIAALAWCLVGCSTAGTAPETTAAVVEEATPAEVPTSVIVKGSDMKTVKELVLQVGGTVTHELGIIHAVGAKLTSAQRQALLELDPSLRIHEDSTVEASARDGDTGVGAIEPQFTQLIDADRVHEDGITGRGITVAILDTGLWSVPPLAQDTAARDRILASYDAKRDVESVGQARDRNGHGSHVASVIANSEANAAGDFNGVAPDVDLVIVKAFNGAGKGTYADVIRGLEWVVDNRRTYGIRVLNLSLSARPRTYYWDDPLNQAVMTAWQAGIVVVTSAGNGGPDAMTVGVPGNVPYVITVGAMTDNYTPSNGTDDILASFSATGPTAAGFAKPEIVAPGGHIPGTMNRKARIARKYPRYHDGGRYFTMSGTSQAAAVITGVAALMLDANPSLKPDDVKCRLMSSARPALDKDGSLAYSVLQQGAGLVNAYDAVNSRARRCANKGLNIRADLNGGKHFNGPARVDETGGFYILGHEDNVWSGRYVKLNGFVWSDEPVRGSAFVWSDGFVWSDYAAWVEGFVWSDGLFEKACINQWVPQE